MNKITVLVTVFVLQATSAFAGFEIPHGGGPDVFAPEPISSALFLLGAGTLALRKYRSRKKNN